MFCSVLLFFVCPALDSLERKIEIGDILIQNETFNSKE